MANTIITGEVRFSFLNVWEPRTNADGQGEPKYSVTLLIPKTDVATYQAIQLGIQQALQEGLSTFGGQMPARPSIPLYDGDGVRPNGEDFGDECRGHWVITASSKQQPQIVDVNVSPIINRADIYSGCYGRASVRFFAYNKAGKKGIGCGLGNVQKIRDGQPLAGGTTAEEDFGQPNAPQYQPPQPQFQPTQVTPPQFPPMQYQPIGQPAVSINPITGLPY